MPTIFSQSQFNQPQPDQELKQKKTEEKINDKPQRRLQGLRTLRDDALRFVKEKGVTWASVAMLQKEKQAEIPKLRESRSSTFLFVFLGLLILTGIAAGVFFFIFKKPVIAPTQETRPPKPAALYPASDEQTIEVSRTPADFILPWKELLLEHMPAGQFRNVLVFGREKNAYLDAREWFELLEIPLPPQLSRSFRSPWNVGIFGLDENNAVVFLIPVSSFAEAFNGMLVLEKDLPFALRNILPQDHPVRDLEQFVDRVIANHNVRILEKNDRQLLFAYTFFGRKILIMSTSSDAIEAILNRFLLVPPQL